MGTPKLRARTFHILVHVPELHESPRPPAQKKGCAGRGGGGGVETLRLSIAEVCTLLFTHENTIKGIYILPSVWFRNVSKVDRILDSSMGVCISILVTYGYN